MLSNEGNYDDDDDDDDDDDNNNNNNNNNNNDNNCFNNTNFISLQKLIWLTIMDSTFAQCWVLPTVARKIVKLPSIKPGNCCKKINKKCNSLKQYVE